WGGLRRYSGSEGVGQPNADVGAIADAAVEIALSGELVERGDHGSTGQAIPLGECARRRHACPSSQSTIQDPGSNLLIEPLPKGRLRGGICHRELERVRRPHIAMGHEIQMNWTFWLVHIRANFGSSERQRQRGGSMPLRSVMRTIGTAVTLMAAPLLPVARNPSPRQTGDATRVRDRNVRVMLDLFRA